MLFPGFVCFFRHTRSQLRYAAVWAGRDVRRELTPTHTRDLWRRICGTGCLYGFFEDAPADADRDMGLPDAIEVSLGIRVVAGRFDSDCNHISASAIARNTRMCPNHSPAKASNIRHIPNNKSLVATMAHAPNWSLSAILPISELTSRSS